MLFCTASEGNQLASTDKRRKVAKKPAQEEPERLERTVFVGNLPVTFTHKVLPHFKASYMTIMFAVLILLYHRITIMVIIISHHCCCILSWAMIREGVSNSSGDLKPLS